VCDLYSKRVDIAKGVVGGNCEGFADYRKMLERKDIDAVVIATHDIWHSQCAVDTMNAGKRSLQLDLNHPDSREVVLDLVRWADVVVESYSPRAMRGWGAASGAPCILSGIRQHTAGDAQGHGHEDGMDQSARVAPHGCQDPRRKSGQLGR